MNNPNQSSRPPKIGFISTLQGVITGTAVFPRLLMANSAIRAFSHLIILAILGAIFITAVEYYRNGWVFSEIGVSLETEYGQLNIANHGITPTKNPEKPRVSTHITEDFLLDYFPSPNAYPAITDTTVSADQISAGVLWDPRIIIYWKRIDTSMIQTLPLVFSSNIDPNALTTQFDSLSALRNKVKSLPPIQLNEPITTPLFLLPPTSYSFIELLTYSQISYFVGAGLLSNAIVTILIILIVSTFFSLSSVVFADRNAIFKLKFHNYLTLCLYSSFPGIIIASLWSALHLPWFEHSTICIFGLLIYIFPVQFRVQRFFAPPAPPTSRNRAIDDDDDF